MSVLTILEYPDQRLRTVAKPVTEITADTQRIIDDMIETMYASKGVGLAATQVNIHLRIVVMDLSEEGNSPEVLINPSYEPIGEEKSEIQEGCLSVPGFFELLDRYEHVRLTAQDRDGNTYTKDHSGLAAVCVQHELDHLQGVLFVDSLSRLKQTRIRDKLNKKKS